MIRVVLRSDVPNLGKKGDICEVADGYARNFLLPQGHAIPASAGAASKPPACAGRVRSKDAHDRQAAETVARALVPHVIRISMRPAPRAGCSGP